MNILFLEHWNVNTPNTQVDKQELLCSSWTTRHSVSTFLLFDNVSMNSSSLFLFFHFILNCTANTFLSLQGNAASSCDLFLHWSSVSQRGTAAIIHHSLLINHRPRESFRSLESTQGSSLYNSQQSQRLRKETEYENRSTESIHVSLLDIRSHRFVTWLTLEWISPGCTHTHTDNPP